MPHIEVSDRKELFQMIKTAERNPFKREEHADKASTPKQCPYCQEKSYPVHSKGRVFWMGCKCKTARPYSKKTISG